MRIINEGLIRDLGYAPGSILYLKNVRVKDIQGKEIDAPWKTDNKENGHPFVLLWDNVAVAQETFALMLTSYSSDDISNHVNGYNIVIPTDELNKLPKENSLLQSFYICRVDASNILPQYKQRIIDEKQLEQAIYNLYIFQDDHPEIKILEIVDMLENKKHKLNENFNINTDYDKYFANISLNDIQGFTMWGNFYLHNNMTDEDYFMTYVYSVDVNVLELFENGDEYCVGLELTNDSDYFNIIYNNTDIPNEDMYCITALFIDFLNTRDRYLIDNAQVEQL